MYKSVLLLLGAAVLTSCVVAPVQNTGLRGSVLFSTENVGNTCSINAEFTNHTPVPLQPVIHFTVLDKDGNTLKSASTPFGMIATGKKQTTLATMLFTACNVNSIVVTRAYDAMAPSISIQGVAGNTYTFKGSK